MHLQHSSGGAEENHEKPQSTYSVLAEVLDRDLSPRSRSADYCTATFRMEVQTLIKVIQCLINSYMDFIDYGLCVS
jgi:hypothetical protein